MGKTVSVNIDRVIINLLCWYAFFVPMELILEVFFGIDTILKPYRLLAMLIIVCFLFRARFRWTPNREFYQDIFLYIVFIYGLIVTLIRMMTSIFNLNLFFNDAFQISLYLGVFIVLRHINVQRKDLYRIILFLSAGIILNAVVVFNSFFFLKIYKRDGGLMDNPNYMALSVAVLIIFLIIQYPVFQGLLKRVIWLSLILFLGYVVILAGSRTALAILVISVVLMLYYSTVKVRVGLIGVLIILMGIVSFGGLDILESNRPLALVNRLKKDSSEENRLSIWKGAYEGAETVNFTGMGIGQFKARFREFYTDSNHYLIRRIIESGYYLSPHSDYLAFLVIYGVIGLLGYLIFMFSSLKKVFFKYLNEAKHERKRHYQYCFLILVSLMIFGVANENVVSPLFWLLLSISTRVNFEEEATTEQLTEQLTEVYK